MFPPSTASHQISALLWLKVRLSLGAYKKTKALLVGLAIGAPFVVAFSLALYFAALVVLWAFPAEMSRPMFHGALATLYIMWLAAPLLAASVNESLDLSKILQYPIPPGRLYFANILGGFLDMPVLTALIPLLTIPIGLATNPLTAILLLFVLVVFVFHTISLSQAVTTLLWGLLRSRRIKDVWFVLVSVGGIVFFSGYQVMIRRFDETAMGYLMVARPDRVVKFSPPGWAVDAAFALNRGDWLSFAWRISLLLIVCYATVRIAGVLVHRIVTGDLALEKYGNAKASGEAVSRSNGSVRRRNQSRLARFLPPAVAAMYELEWRTMMRDPAVKVDLVRNIGWMVAWPIILIFSSSDNGQSGLAYILRSGAWVFVGVMAALGMATYVISHNIFARDRSGIGLLFTLPTRRMDIIVGKNLANMVFATAGNLILCAVAAWLVHRPALFPAAVIAGQSLALVCVAAGNILSVYHPYPLPERGQNPYGTRSSGFTFFGCFGFILMIAAAVCLSLPVAGAFVVPLLLRESAWLWLSIPAAVVYAVFVWWLMTRAAANGLSNREPEVLAALLKSAV